MESLGKSQKEDRKRPEEATKRPEEARKRPGRGQKRPGRGQKRPGRGQKRPGTRKRPESIIFENKPQKARNPEFCEKLLETQCFMNRK